VPACRRALLSNASNFSYGELPRGTVFARAIIRNGRDGMSLLNELRIRARHVLFPAFGVSAVLYFAYHGINGDRGLLAWRGLEQEVESARAELNRTRGEREALERRVKLLYSESLDPDMLGESARRLLNYGRPEEIVILFDEAPRRQ
jgi:cell division protein FtsB